MRTKDHDSASVARRIERLNPKYNIFVASLPIDTHNDARPVTPLAGLPFAAKDNFCTIDFNTTCASALLESYRPPYNATVIDRLLQGGANLVGKTNMDEFAMGSSTEHSVFGPSANPWDVNRVAGGSSGGSAAAVAAELVPFALGSDTGGSVRQPAAFCGVIGFKPTYGLLSRYGLVAFASSLDTVGLLARDVPLIGQVLNCLVGRDPLDSTSYEPDARDFVPSQNDSLRGAKIASFTSHVAAFSSPGVHDAMKQALTVARSLGAQIDETTPPFSFEDALAAYHIIADAEASSNLARFDGIRYGVAPTGAGRQLQEHYRSTRSKGFGSEVQRRIALGTFVLSEGYRDQFYDRAQRYRQVLTRSFADLFDAGFQLIALPTTPDTAFVHGAAHNPLEMYRSDLFTLPASLAGCPAISIPCGRDPQGLPVGLQLIGPPRSDATLLSAAQSWLRELEPLPRCPSLPRGVDD